MAQPVPSVSFQTTPTRVRYLVLAWLCALATLSYIHRICISVPAVAIQEELPLSEDQMYWVLNAFFIGYAIFQIPSGWLGDRLGTRLALAIFTGTWSLATALTALPLGFGFLFAARLAMGIAQAGIFPCAVNSIARWFPLTQRAFPSGMLGSFMSIGAVIGTQAAAILLLWASWQTVFVGFAVPGLVAAVWFYIWFRDRPEQHSWVNDAEVRLIQGNACGLAEKPAAEPTPWLMILTSVPMLLICMQQFCRAAGYSFYLALFPKYLQQGRGVSESDLIYFVAQPHVGVVLGSLAGGIFMDWVLRRTGSRTLSRKGTALGGLLATGILLVLAYFIADPFLAVPVLALGSFCAGLAGPAGYTVTIDLGGRHVATVFSVMNMAGNIGAVVLVFAVNELVKNAGWEPVLLFLAGLYFTAAGCWSLVNVKGSIVEPVSPASAKQG